MVSKPFLGASLLGLGAAAALGVTNPGEAQYEDFAVAQARDYLKAEVCPEPLPLVGTSLADECIQFLGSEAAQPQLQGLISNNTERQNFLLFSLYKTDLAIESLLPFIPSGLVPSYEVKAVGVLKTFYIYSAEKI